MDLLDLMSVSTPYPHSPGHRGVETSRKAALEVTPSAATLQTAVLNAIRRAGPRGLTTNECVDALDVARDSVQPRTSELKAKGLIRDSGERRRNANGKSAIVWVAVAQAGC